MKKFIIILCLTASAFIMQAKNWSLIHYGTESDTITLRQDASDAQVYKFIGNFSTTPFKLTDGSNVYIPRCGMGDPMGQTVDMALQTDTSETGFRVKYLNRARKFVLTLTDGTSPRIRVDQALPYAHIYLVGGPVNTHDPNWLLGDARELDKDPEDPFIFYYRGFLKYNSFGDERGSLKFLTSNSSWSPAFHPEGTGNIALSQASSMRLDGADTKWEIPADGSGNGYYVIRLNTLDMTVKVLSFTASNVDYPGQVYITGDAMPCGWVNGSPEVMSPTDIFSGKYSWTGMVKPGQFKFLKVKNSWGSCYVSSLEDQPIVFDREYPVIYEFEYYNNGGKDYKFLFRENTECTIQLDLSTMTLKVKKTTTDSKESLLQESPYAVTVHQGKVILSSSSTSLQRLTVYRYDGSKLYDFSFSSRIEFLADKGCYILQMTDLDGMYLGKLKVLVT